MKKEGEVSLKRGLKESRRGSWKGGAEGGGRGGTGTWKILEVILSPAEGTALARTGFLESSLWRWTGGPHPPLGGTALWPSSLAPRVPLLSCPWARLLGKPF